MAKSRFFFLPDEPVVASAVPRRSAGSTLRASARVDPIGEANEQSGSQKKAQQLSQAWQAEAWRYYDSIGEVKYAAGFLGACLSRCKLTIGIVDDDGHVGPAFDDVGKPVTDENDQVIPGMEHAQEALQLVRSLKSDVGGQSQMLRLMGINVMVPGEFHLVGSPRDPEASTRPALTDVSSLYWEVLSTDEFRAKDTGYARVRVPGAAPEEIDQNSVHAIRVWKVHPRYSELPDSTIMGVLEILEELLLLTRQVRGETLSRLAAAGLLLVPDEIEYVTADSDNDSDIDDPFTHDLIKTMSTAIGDKSSPAGSVPMVVRAPKDLLHPDAFRWMQVTPDNTSSDAAAKRSEAVMRFAQGVDLPVEIVTGHMNTTFSNAVQIDDSLFKSHIEPVLEIICDALTVGFLRPALGDDIPFVVHYDSSELVARPNRAQDAKDAYDRVELGGASLRSSLGFSDSDAPDDEEIAARIALMNALGHKLPGIGGTPMPNPMPNPQDGSQANEDRQEKGNNLDGDLAASIQAAAEVTVDRAVLRAGARLRSKAAGAPTRELLSQVPDAEVAVTLGPQKVAELIPKDLFHREFDTLHSYVLRRTNDRARADAVRDGCTKLAEQRLWSPRQPFPRLTFDA